MKNNLEILKSYGYVFIENGYIVTSIRLYRDVENLIPFLGATEKGYDVAVDKLYGKIYNTMLAVVTGKGKK